jgi:hypothetical protein
MRRPPWPARLGSPELGHRAPRSPQRRHKFHQAHRQYTRAKPWRAWRLGPLWFLRAWSQCAMPVRAIAHGELPLSPPPRASPGVLWRLSRPLRIHHCFGRSLAPSRRRRAWERAPALLPRRLPEPPFQFKPELKKVDVLTRNGLARSCSTPVRGVRFGPNQNLRVRWLKLSPYTFSRFVCLRP